MSLKTKITVCLAAAPLVLPLVLPDAAMCADVMFKQAITSELRYDTNAFVRPEGQHQTGDMVLLITPQFNLSTERRGITLTGYYSPSGSIYFNNSELNSISHYASVGMNTQLTQKWSLNASDVFTYSKETLDTSLIGIQTSRANVWSNTANIGTAYSLTDKASVSLSFSDNIFRSDDPSAIRSRTDSASLGLGYNATANTSLNASYGHSNFYFDTPQGTNNIETHSGSAGITHRFPYSLDVSLSGGANYTPSFSKKYDWIASATVKKSFQYSSASLEYSRGITNTSGLTDQLNIHDRYSAVVDYSITRSTDLIIFGDYSQSRSKPVDLVRIKSYSAGIRGKWQMYSWMSMEAGYSHFKQVSDGLIGDDFKRDHFFVSMTITTYEGKI